ncbi:MAG TPA: hypothetical protein VF707_05295 [Ardenticatenaceae bacterium]|jgi:hypothetical protein
MHQRGLHLLLLLLLLLLTGCNGPATPSVREGQPTEQAVTTNEEDEAVTEASTDTATVDEQATEGSSRDVIASPSLPEAGKATIIGRIVAEQTGEPIANIGIQLAFVYRNEDGGGNYVLDTTNSPATSTNEEGEFVLLNIDAAEYVMVVGNVENGEGAYQVVPGTDGRARVWNAESGKILDAEDVQVNIPRLPN